MSKPERWEGDRRDELFDFMTLWIARREAYNRLPLIVRLLARVPGAPRHQQLRELRAQEYHVEGAVIDHRRIEGTRRAGRDFQARSEEHRG